MADQAQTHMDSAGSHGAHSGATVRSYIQIFVVLFLVTAVEVLASYLVNIGVPEWAQIAVLIVLAFVKGAMVVMFYMHLRFDSRWFSFFFVSAVILATGCLIAFLALFSYHRTLT